MKTRSWRLVAHVSLMGVVGSLMVPLLVGVEASVGATDKTQEHSAVGLFLLVVYFGMVFAGRIRFLKLRGRKVGRKTYFWSALLHKYGGLVIVFLAWWNCYTGLVRISPEDSFFQVFVLSSFPLGYDIPVFGVIRQYVFFPYLGFVCIIFVFAEARRYRMNGSSHAGKLKGILEGNESIWEENADQFLDKMTMESFLEATKLGSALCIVDGYVLDITTFMENHPGGQHLLRYAAGSDITEEFVGARDVDGLKHVHSHSALELMKTFVLAVLVDDSNKKLSFLTGASSRAALSHSPQSGNTRASRLSIVKPTSYRGPSVFRRGRVVGMRYLTPDIEITHTSKPVILLQLALPKTRSDLQVQKLMSLPSCAFTFRAVDQNRVAVDRQYTPVKINNDYTLRRSYQGNKDDEEIFDFIISLVPGGKLSKILLDTRMGKMMLAQGPTVNQEIVQVFRTGGWKSVVLIAAGTGVSPMLQVIDFYLSRLSSEFRGVESKLDSDCPDLYLMWIVKGPKYNYSDALALDTRVERSQGKFKYTVIYSSSQGKREEETVQKPKHGWTFKQIVDKTVPSREVLTGRLGFSAKLGLLKPKKVKHQVVDAAWKLKRGTSFRAERKGMSKRFNSASTRKRKDRLDAMNSMLDDIDEGDRNEITEETWLGDEVQANYRSYDKMLLEELLLSIPSDLVSRERKRASSEMPFIVEEEKSDSESDFLSGSDIPGDITLETETESSPATEAEEKEFEDGIPWLPQRKEDRSDTRPPSSPRSSWLSPVSARKHSEALVAKSLEEAQQNSSSIDDDQYESLDHKRLKRQNSPSRWGMAGGVIEPPKPELLPKPVSLQPPTRSPSSPPKLPSAAPVPPSNREKSDKPKTEKKEPVPTEKKKRPSLEDRTESKRPPQTPLGRISFLAKQGQRVEEDLNQFELAEQEYRDSKILVAISGAPMFEYKTRVILHEELAFPKEQMVTFHTSAQQI
jgi:cytochrome b involved in lipid metabolism